MVSDESVRPCPLRSIAVEPLQFPELPFLPLRSLRSFAAETRGFRPISHFPSLFIICVHPVHLRLKSLQFSETPRSRNRQAGPTALEPRRESRAHRPLLGCPPLAASLRNRCPESSLQAAHARCLRTAQTPADARPPHGSALGRRAILNLRAAPIAWFSLH